MRTSLSESRKRLAPLEEPFDIDLGLHRWLEDEREEAYSDWLEWVVRQILEMLGPKQVFELFGLTPPEAVLECREWDVRANFVFLMDTPIGKDAWTSSFALETKRSLSWKSRRGMQTSRIHAKHCGYKLWIDEQKLPARNTRCCWLCPPKKKTTRAFFPFVGFGLRRDAATGDRHPQRGESDDCRDGTCISCGGGAEFIGLLARIVQDICEKRLVLFNVEVVNHLEKFIKRLEE